MSTVSLQMIVKDEYESVADLIAKAEKYFDKINLTVSDKKTADKLAKLRKIFPNLHVVHREWNDRFDDARNDNYSLCTTDYAFWLDADDTFDFRAIPKLVEIADEGNYGAIFLPYNYAQDDQGRCVTRHWRERLTRRSVPFEWRGWVHESQISETPYTSHRVNVEVVHHSTPGHAQESVTRNHAILMKAAEETHDPRYIHYLGMSYFTHKEWSKAIQILTDYLEVGGSVEDIYRSLSMISEAAYHLTRHNEALEYAAKAAILIPEYPMAYWLLAQYEADQDNFGEALEWIRVSETKPDPDTLSIFDPTSRERAVLIAARCEFMLKNFNAALAWLRKAPNTPEAQDLIDDFTKEADAETFVKLLPKIRQYFIDDEALWASLCEDMKYDTRLRALRHKATSPRRWGMDSVVILCGQGYEEWGPHTLDKGMGGSEEAIVYLTPELAKLGYNVTVYGEVPEEMFVDGVTWLPWKQFDDRDEFNIFVSWRAPVFTEHVTAKQKFVDVHDVLPKEQVKDYPDVKYFVKSQMHRDLYPDLPDDKFIIIGNGIRKDQFNDSTNS